MTKASNKTDFYHYLQKCLILAVNGTWLIFAFYCISKCLHNWII